MNVETEKHFILVCSNTNTLEIIYYYKLMFFSFRYHSHSLKLIQSFLFSAHAPEMPDGPFNPVNYSGTQINVWGAPPNAWPGMNANSGAVTFGLPNQGMSPYTTQFGYLTENMIHVSAFH